jgi:hypothetical protein
MQTSDLINFKNYSLVVCLPCWYISLGFEVLTAVVMKNSVFWDIVPCSLLKVNWRFGGTCCLQLQGQIISQARNQQSSAQCLLHAGFLLGLFVDLEIHTSLDFLDEMLLNPTESHLENSFLKDYFDVRVNDLSSIMTRMIILDGFISSYACSVHLITKNVG